MGKKSFEHYPLYRLTNRNTGESFEARGIKPVVALAGLQSNYNSTMLHKTKKWCLEQIDDPLVWDEAAYRQGLYKKTAHRYKSYEDRKLLRDPLYEKRKQCRLKKLRNLDGTHFTAEQHELVSKRCCEVCGSSDKICVDHCHDSGVVRGALCWTCNVALGHLKDNPSRIRALADYAELHAQSIKEANVRKEQGL